MIPAQRERESGARRRMTVRELTLAPGELAFETEVDEPRRVSFRTSAEITPRAEAVVPATLLPAMAIGGELAVPAALNGRLLRRLPDVQSILLAFTTQPGAFAPLKLHGVNVVADREAGPSTGTAVAAFFSGGVDPF